MTSALGQLQPVSLRDQARRALWSAIATGELAAGEIYSAAQVAAKLGVSTTPVREAILDLANEGLVEVIRNRGFRVPEVSDHDLDELFELRLILETAAVDLMIERADGSEFARCGRLSAEVAFQAKRGDAAAFLEADRDFHLALLDLCQNARLVDMVRRLREQTRLYGLPQLARHGKLDDAVAEHEDLLTAVEARDAEAAKSALRRHIRHTRGLWAGRPEESRGTTS